MRLPRDLVMNLGVDDVGPEVIFRFDGRGNLFAEHHRFGRGIDGHFEFRLLVFFDSEIAAAEVFDPECVNAEGRV